MFLNQYYPEAEKLHEITDGYDKKDGKHLSNECKFLYAFCFIEKFNNMNLSQEEKNQFYKDYINNAKHLSFEEVLQNFSVDLSNPLSVADDFINTFNNALTIESLDNMRL